MLLLVQYIHSFAPYLDHYFYVSCCGSKRPTLQCTSQYCTYTIYNRDTAPWLCLQNCMV